MGDQQSGSKIGGDILGFLGTQLGNFAGLGSSAIEKAATLAKAQKEVPGLLGRVAGAANVVGQKEMGLLGAAGNFTSGFGKLVGGEDIAQGFIEMIGAAGDVAATETDNPWVGAVGPLFRGLSAGVTMYQNADQCSIDAPMVDNKCYTAMGDAAFAVAEAVPFSKPFGSVAKWGLDGLGALAGIVGGDDYAFSSGSAVGGILHGGARGAKAGVQGAGWLVDKASQGAGWLADQAGQGAGWAVDQAGGLVDRAGAAIDGLMPGGVEFSPTGVPMTVPAPTSYTAPDPMEELERGVMADRETWPATYAR